MHACTYKTAKLQKMNRNTGKNHCSIIFDACKPPNATNGCVTFPKGGGPYEESTFIFNKPFERDTTKLLKESTFVSCVVHLLAHSVRD